MESIEKKQKTSCARDYEAALVEFKSWAIIYCTLSIIPLLWPAVIFGEAIGTGFHISIYLLIYI